jgi:hypothetical protein
MPWKGSKRSSWNLMEYLNGRELIMTSAISPHLDNADVCLNGLCICEKFGVDKKVEVAISPKAIIRKNLRRSTDFLVR